MSPASPSRKKRSLAKPALDGCRVAILVADGFEQDELTSSRIALEQAGGETEIVSPSVTRVRGWNHGEWGGDSEVDVPLDSADPEDYDALLLPDGVMNLDELRGNAGAMEFVMSFIQAGKPVAAIGHGPSALVNSGALRGRTLTSRETIKEDLANAGAHWTDAEVVTDRGLITSRRPEDLPAFNHEFIEQLSGKSKRSVQSGKSK